MLRFAGFSLGVSKKFENHCHMVLLPAALRPCGSLAMSIERKGGSPIGRPTGPVVFTGTLVAAR